mmetsp:Transcript_36048/g.77750  ORF Transcript_36048/g.77750 Transcript_36048/m.77750 type:complete len:298 (+) Transcript_36048:1273-2166(+)
MQRAYHGIHSRIRAGLLRRADLPRRGVALLPHRRAGAADPGEGEVRFCQGRDRPRPDHPDIRSRDVRSQHLQGPHGELGCRHCLHAGHDIRHPRRLRRSAEGRQRPPHHQDREGSARIQKTQSSGRADGRAGGGGHEGHTEGAGHGQTQLRGHRGGGEGVMPKADRSHPALTQAPQSKNGGTGEGAAEVLGGGGGNPAAPGGRLPQRAVQAPEADQSTVHGCDRQVPGEGGEGPGGKVPGREGGPDRLLQTALQGLRPVRGLFLRPIQQRSLRHAHRDEPALGTLQAALHRPGTGRT